MKICVVGKGGREHAIARLAVIVVVAKVILRSALRSHGSQHAAQAVGNARSGEQQRVAPSTR